MTEIAQEKCDHAETETETESDSTSSGSDPGGESDNGNSDDEKKNETGKWSQKSQIFSKGTRKGGLANLFR